MPFAVSLFDALGAGRRLDGVSGYELDSALAQSVSSEALLGEEATPPPHALSGAAH